MVRVEITNYESIEHAVVEIDGFTTVQGPNYTGKSAIMRAINAALTNPPGMECISWGKTFCEVRLTTHGLNLLWHKEDGNNFYEINGTRYSKIGKEEPPQELNSLGYGTVKINGQRYNLHYAEQFSPLFLVDEQNTKSADLLATVYGLDRLYKASELCSKDQKSNHNILKIRKADLERIDKDLKRFDGLDDVLKVREKLESSAAKISSMECELLRLQKWESSVRRLADECNRVKPALSVSIPNDEHISENCLSLDLAKNMFNKIVETMRQIKSLEPAKDVHVPDAGHIIKRIEGYCAVKTMSERYESVSADFDKISEIESVRIPDPQHMLSRISKLSTILNLAEKMSSIKKDIETISAESEVAVRDLSSVENDLSKFDVCPLCGKRRSA